MSHEPPIPESWRRRIDRLARSIDDVASSQHDLQAQIDQLTSIVAGLSQPEDAISEPVAAGPVGPPGVPINRRWLRPVSRLARAGVRATLGIARRAWDTAHPDPPWTDQVRVEVGAPATTLPSVAVIVDVESLGLGDSESGGTSTQSTSTQDALVRADRARAAQTDTATSWWIWSRSASRVESVGADNPSPTTVASPSDLACDYLWVITPNRLTAFRSTGVESARWALAYDCPDVLQLDSQAFSDSEIDRCELIVRRSLWHAETGVDRPALRARAALDDTGVLGRDSSGIKARGTSAHRVDGHRFRDEAGAILRRSGAWWVPARSEPRSYTHHVFPVSAASESSTDSDTTSDPRPTYMIVLATPLVAGCERQLADLIDAVGSDARIILTGLVAGGVLASSRWRLLAARAAHAYPIWAVLPDDAHGIALAALARQWQARDILVIGPGDQMDRLHHAWVDALDGRRMIHLPWNGRASRTAAVETLHPIEPIVAADGRTDASAGATLRASLAIPSTAVVVGLMADLVDTERPEDFVMVADRLRDDPHIAFLLGGDGPLAERVADLANLLPPSQIFWTRTGFDAETFIAACDVVCGTAERRPTLAPLRLAAMAKRPIVATNVDATAPLLDDGPCGLLYEPGDVNALASALVVMKDPAVRAAYASAGPAAAARAQPGAPHVAWRAALRLAPEA